AYQARRCPLDTVVFDRFCRGFYEDMCDSEHPGRRDRPHASRVGKRRENRRLRCLRRRRRGCKGDPYAGNAERIGNSEDTSDSVEHAIAHPAFGQSFFSRGIGKSAGLGFKGTEIAVVPSNVTGVTWPAWRTTCLSSMSRLSPTLNAARTRTVC